MELTQYRLQLMANVGPVNEKKEQMVHEKFKSRYPILGKEQSGNGFVMMGNEGKSIILVQNNRIIFQHAEQPTQVPFEQLSDDVAALSDILLLDDNCAAHTYMVGIDDCPSSSSLEASKTFLEYGDDESFISEFPELRGIGLRFFTQNNEDAWEFKIEPLVNDPTKYFFEASCAHKVLPRDEVISESKRSYTYFTTTLRSKLDRFVK